MLGRRILGLRARKHSSAKRVLCDSSTKSLGIVATCSFRCSCSHRLWISSRPASRQSPALPALSGLPHFLAQQKVVTHGVAIGLSFAPEQSATSAPLREVLLAKRCRQMRQKAARAAARAAAAGARSASAPPRLTHRPGTAARPARASHFEAAVSARRLVTHAPSRWASGPRGRASGWRKWGSRAHCVWRDRARSVLGDASTDQRFFGEVGRVRANFAEIEPDSVEFGQCWTTPGQQRWKSSQLWPMSGPSREFDKHVC